MFFSHPPLPKPWFAPRGNRKSDRIRPLNLVLLEFSSVGFCFTNWWRFPLPFPQENSHLINIEDPELELALIPDHSVLINTAFISDCGRIFQDLEMAIKSSIGPRRSAVSSAPDRWQKIKRKNSDNDGENQLSSVFPLRFLFFDRIVLNV